jgi:hypothetical protein
MVSPRQRELVLRCFHYTTLTADSDLRGTAKDREDFDDSEGRNRNPLPGGCSLPAPEGDQGGFGRFEELTRQYLRAMNQNQELQTSLARSHEDTKKFKVQNSRFKLFFVHFVTSCENWVLVLAQKLDSKFETLVRKVL